VSSVPHTACSSFPSLGPGWYISHANRIAQKFYYNFSYRALMAIVSAETEPWAPYVAR